MILKKKISSFLINICPPSIWTISIPSILLNEPIANYTLNLPLKFIKGLKLNLQIYIFVKIFTIVWVWYTFYHLEFNFYNYYEFEGLSFTMESLRVKLKLSPYWVMFFTVNLKKKKKKISLYFSTDSVSFTRQVGNKYRISSAIIHKDGSILFVYLLKAQFWCRGLFKCLLFYKSV